MNPGSPLLLVTGGAGFIGSHVCLNLLQAGYHLRVFDNFSTARPGVLGRVRQLAGCGQSALQLVEGDMRSPADLAAAFGGEPVQAVLHLAGLKSVVESVADPRLYEHVNVEGSRHLVAAMQRAGCRRLVFSSSAAVYGNAGQVPIDEAAAIRPLNPYGGSKAAVEQLLREQVAQTSGGPTPWRVIGLRYFNAVGGHPSGQLGEDPLVALGNLFPLVRQVVAGQRPALVVCGSDWPTPDGTGIRDYIHVLDLAEGHRAALHWVLQEPSGWLAVNLGTGRGYSVLEVLAAFEQASGHPIPRRLEPRRPGDGAISVANPALAERELGWLARRSLAEMARDALAWRGHQC